MLTEALPKCIRQPCCCASASKMTFPLLPWSLRLSPTHLPPMRAAEETPKQKKKLKQAAAASVGGVVDSEGNAAVSVEKKKVRFRPSPTSVAQRPEPRHTSNIC